MINPARRPWLQFMVLVIASVVGGMLILGSLFDALTNSATLMVPPYNYFAAAVIAMFWLAVTLTVRFVGVKWRFRAGVQSITRLNHPFHACLLGMFILVWLPAGWKLFESSWWSPKSSNLRIELGALLTAYDRNKSGGLWLAREDYVAPVNCAVLVRITNVTQAPIGIRTLRLERQLAPGGDWEPLWAMDKEARVFCCVGESSKLNMLHEIQLSRDGLLGEIRSGPVPPQSQIVNWLLYEFPKDLEVRKDMSLRLVVVDLSGQSVVAESGGDYRLPPEGSRPGLYDAGGKPVRPEIRRELDRLVMKAVATPPVSLAHFRISHFQDESPELPATPRGSILP